VAPFFNHHREPWPGIWAHTFGIMAHLSVLLRRPVRLSSHATGRC